MSNRDWCFKCYHARECMCEKAKHPQADLLEKLDMIKEAVERNPEQWWEEIEMIHPYDGSKHSPKSPKDLIDALSETIIEIRLKPQRVKVEGEVDNELIQTAIIVRDTVGGNPGKVAQALLQLVKDSND